MINRYFRYEVRIEYGPCESDTMNGILIWITWDSIHRDDEDKDKRKVEKDGSGVTKTR